MNAFVNVQIVIKLHFSRSVGNGHRYQTGRNAHIFRMSRYWACFECVDLYKIRIRRRRFQIQFVLVGLVGLVGLVVPVELVELVAHHHRQWWWSVRVVAVEVLVVVVVLALPELGLPVANPKKSAEIRKRWGAYDTLDIRGGWKETK